MAKVAFDRPFCSPHANETQPGDGPWPCEEFLGVLVVLQRHPAKLWPWARRGVQNPFFAELILVDPVAGLPPARAPGG